MLATDVGAQAFVPCTPQRQTKYKVSMRPDPNITYHELQLPNFSASHLLFTSSIPPKTFHWLLYPVKNALHPEDPRHVVFRLCHRSSSARRLVRDE